MSLRDMCALRGGRAIRPDNAPRCLAIRQDAPRHGGEDFFKVAVYHFTGKVVSRGAGHSVTAKAAYRAAERIDDERTGQTHDYTRKQGVEFSGIYLPKDAPETMRDRAALWNAVEAKENRKDSTLARDYELSLPHELTAEQRRYLVQDFIRENFVRKGYAVDLNIHAPDRNGDQRNHHAHILVTDRRLEKDGFAADKKERQGTQKQRTEELETLRERWAELGARHLARAGFETEAERFRQGHQTLEQQSAAARERGDLEHAEACDREATRKMGKAATAMERRGIQTDRGDENRAIEARNAERAALREAVREIQQRERAAAWLEKISRPGVLDAQGAHVKALKVEQVQGFQNAPEATRDAPKHQPATQPTPEHQNASEATRDAAKPSPFAALPASALERTTEATRDAEKGRKSREQETREEREARIRKLFEEAERRKRKREEAEKTKGKGRTRSKDF
jgi:hypothetical protein